MLRSVRDLLFPFRNSQPVGHGCREFDILRVIVRVTIFIFTSFLLLIFFFYYVFELFDFDLQNYIFLNFFHSQCIEFKINSKYFRRFRL